MGLISYLRAKHIGIKQKFVETNPNYVELVSLNWKEKQTGVTRFLKIVFPIFLATLSFPLFASYQDNLIIIWLSWIIPSIVFIFVLERILFHKTAIETFYSTSDQLILHHATYGKGATKHWNRTEFPFIVSTITGEEEQKYEFILWKGERPESDLENYIFTIPGTETSNSGGRFLENLEKNDFNTARVHYKKATWCGQCTEELDKYEKGESLNCPKCNSLIEFK